MTVDDYPILRHDGVVQERELSVIFQFEEETVCIPKSLMKNYDEKYCRPARWKAEQEGIECYEV